MHDDYDESITFTLTDDERIREHYRWTTIHPSLIYYDYDNDNNVLCV